MVPFTFVLRGNGIWYEQNTQPISRYDRHIQKLTSEDLAKLHREFFASLAVLGFHEEAAGAGSALVAGAPIPKVKEKSVRSRTQMTSFSFGSKLPNNNINANSGAGNIIQSSSQQPAGPFLPNFEHAPSVEVIFYYSLYLY